MATLTWLGSGSLQPGDGFRWDFTECWIEDPCSDTNELLDGDIDLLGYTEVINDDQIMRIGIEPLGPDPGGVIFDDPLVRELAEVLLGAFFRLIRR